MTIFLLIICLILLLCNTALLLALCGTMAKILQPAEPPQIRQGYVSDVPVPRSPNYSDLVLFEKPSDDIRIIRDL